MESTRSGEGITVVNAPKLIEPRGHYSHVCIAGQVAYISGQLPVDSLGNPRTQEPLAVQVEQTLSNLAECLSSAGLSQDDLLHVRVYVTDMANWAEFDRIYSNWLGDHRPARAVAGVAELHFGAAVEVEAIASARGFPV